MSGAIDLGFLGPTSLMLAGRQKPVPAGRQRVALAALALDAGRTVSGANLIDYLWGQEPPLQARQALHTTMARVRKLVGPDVVVARAGGYSLDVPESAIDVLRFRALVAAARAAATTESEQDLLTEALGLWRGDALEGIASDELCAVHVHPLTEEWFTATERLVELRLTAGESGDLVGELRRLIARHPLRESLWCLLMSALAAAGRQADALAAYQEIREQLREQLGVDPGAELAATHATVLDGATPLPRASGQDLTPAAPSMPVPRQVPAPPVRFTGRDEQLLALDELAAVWSQGGGGRTTVAVVDGAGGLGKTALALHWAHRAADRFPDGQLYLNLRGFGPGEPVDSSSAAGTLLSALGVPEDQIPAGAEARSAWLRSTLAGRRVLVVLDNARDVEQVRPLLPGSDAFVLVTSRNQLRGLVSRDGARRLTLAPLSEEESSHLLQRMGAAAPGAVSAAARELARLCGHVPLALAVAAERIARTDTSGPNERLTDLLTDLRDEHRRLDALSGGDDLSTDVRAVLSWSYRAASKDEQALFRLLASTPGPNLDVLAAAALSGRSEAQVRQLLDRLSAAHLVEETGGRRFEQHDLIRAHAAELAASVDDAAQTAQARARLLRWYEGAAIAARKQLQPNQPLTLDEPLPVEPPQFADRDAAIAWLAAERDNLVEAVWAAADAGEDRCAWHLAAGLAAYFTESRPWDHSIALLESGLECARRSDDMYGAALLLACLGDAHHFLELYADSVRFSRQALDAYRTIGDARGEVGMLTNIGTSLTEAGRTDAAIEHHRLAADACRALADPAAEARVLANLAAAYVAAGRYAEGVEVAEQALAAGRVAGRALDEANALDELGSALAGLGSYTPAIGHFHRALEIYREAGHPYEVATLHHLGRTHAAAGHPGRARETLRRAFVRANEFGDPRAAQLRAELANLR